MEAGKGHVLVFSQVPQLVLKSPSEPKTILTALLSTLPGKEPQIPLCQIKGKQIWDFTGGFLPLSLSGHVGP